MTAIVNIVLPYAQRYLFSKHPDLDFEAISTLIETNIRIFVAEKLSVQYDMEGVIVRGGEIEALLSTLDDVKYNLWVSAAGLKSYAVIFAELSRAFFGTRNHDLAHFLYLVLVKVTPIYHDIII